jgi:putative endonuclease
VSDARWTVYVLRCADGSLYTGIAIDLDARLAAHNAGRGAKYTRARLPVAVAWSRGQQDATSARRLEYALKQLTRAEKLRLVDGDEALWRRLRRHTLDPRPTASKPAARKPAAAARKPAASKPAPGARRPATARKPAR